jgi:hypothetical protein
MAAVISLLLREERVRKIFVPANFPLGLARDLRNYKIKVRVKKGGVFPEREFKNAGEIKKISAAIIMAEVGLAEGIQALKSSKISRDGKLMYLGVRATPLSPAAGRDAIPTRKATARCAATSRSSWMPSRARGKPAILATSPARWFADAPANRCAASTTRYGARRKLVF